MITTVPGFMFSPPPAGYSRAKLMRKAATEAFIVLVIHLGHVWKCILHSILRKPYSSEVSRYFSHEKGLKLHSKWTLDWTATEGFWGNPYSPSVFVFVYVYVFVFIGVFVIVQRIYVSDRILGKPVQMHRRPARRFHQGGVACHEDNHDDDEELNWSICLKEFPP